MADREKVCRICRRFVKEDKCPVCNTTDFTKTWKGVILVNNPQDSELAGTLEIKIPGKYAIWVK